MAVACVIRCVLSTRVNRIFPHNFYGIRDVAYLIYIGDDEGPGGPKLFNLFAKQIMKKKKFGC